MLPDLIIIITPQISEEYFLIYRHKLESALNEIVENKFIRQTVHLRII